MRKKTLLLLLVAFLSGLATGCRKDPTTAPFKLEVSPKPGGDSRPANTAPGPK